MSGTINVRGLAVGTRVLLASGIEVEVVGNPEDGVWLFARPVPSPDNPSPGEDEMIFAQDVVEVRTP